MISRFLHSVSGRGTIDFVNIVHKRYGSIVSSIISLAFFENRGGRYSGARKLSLGAAHLDHQEYRLLRSFPLL